MAANFRICVHRNSENLHLKLMGDFDGSSACELLNMLEKSASGVYRIIIHTGCLKHIHPFGRDTFQENLRRLKNDTAPILFTGENASQIAPEERSCM